MAGYACAMNGAALSTSTFALRTVALAPLWLAQGAWTLYRTPRLPEPPGERRGRAGRGPRLRLLIVGDSAAAGVGAPKQDEALAGQLAATLAASREVHWCLEAKTGHTTRDTIGRLQRLPAGTFDVVVQSLGVNDVTRGRSIATWLDEQWQLRELLRQRFGVSRIVVSGLPPVHGFPALPQPLRWHLGTRATEFNEALRLAVAREPDCRFLNLRFTDDVSGMAADGFHPGPPVYAEWARQAATSILE